jgi:hypothetical protein
MFVKTSNAQKLEEVAKNINILGGTHRLQYVLKKMYVLTL